MVQVLAMVGVLAGCDPSGFPRRIAAPIFFREMAPDGSENYVSSSIRGVAGVDTAPGTVPHRDTHARGQRLCVGCAAELPRATNAEPNCSQWRSVTVICSDSRTWRAAAPLLEWLTAWF